ncbi:MAG: aldo/keto reductase [Candidatus Omnitrophica bacterium]|nr:aldo/keto reductase [Candidatus Omnitrophota bacterium]
MLYRRLGKTTKTVSVVAMGGWSIVGDFTWGRQEKRTSLEALQTAYECGITLFDTAESYGDGLSEQLLAEALGRVREKIFIATKVLPGNFSSEKLKASCERSLKNLRTEWIDLYQLHWPNREIPLRQTLDILEELKSQGKIRHYGVSNFGLKDFSGCHQSYEIVSNQLAYNLLFRAIEFEILPFCQQAGISVLCYSPLMQGLLTGKFKTADQVPEERARTRIFSSHRRYTRHGQPGMEKEAFAAIDRLRELAEKTGYTLTEISLAWLLAQNGVTAVIVGGRNKEQILASAKAAEINISPELVSLLSETTEPLKKKLGPNPDMWQSNSRIS